MGGMTRLLLLLWAGVTVSTAKDLYKRIAVAVCDNNQRHHHVKLGLDGGYYCGGTLISNRWILTAKHCKSNTITAHLGLHPRKEETGKEQKKQSIKIEKQVEFGIDDIMLVKLAADADFETVGLPTADDCKNPKKGAKVQIAGYGPRDDNGPISATLRCANTEVVDCVPTGADIGNPGHHFCGNTETVTAMPGDSGGGVMYNNKLYGVISEGIGHPHPMYFMDVCKYLKWISETMKKQ